jgi:hypothetical protein
MSENITKIVPLHHHWTPRKENMHSISYNGFTCNAFQVERNGNIFSTKAIIHNSHKPTFLKS